MRLVYAEVGRRHLPVPVHSLLLERREQNHRGHQFRRKSESRLSNDGFPQEMECTVSRQSCLSGQGLIPSIRVFFFSMS